MIYIKAIWLMREVFAKTHVFFSGMQTRRLCPSCW